MLRVLLVGPYKGKENSSDAFLAPPFGLYRMKFYIESKLKGVNIDILDPSVIDYLKANGPYEIIGFSFLHLTLENDLRVFNYFKLKFPEAIFIAGGIEASFLGKVFFSYAAFDIVAIGEGENTLLGILRNFLKQRKCFANIKSIYFKRDGIVYFSGYGKQLNLNDFKKIYRAYKPGNIPYELYWNNNARLYEHPNWKEIKVVRGTFSNFCQ